MQGITSLEGHDRANKRMRNSLRMVIPQLSEDQKEKIMQDIMETVSPRAEPAMRDNINIGGQQFDMDQLKQMPMQAGQGLADMGQGGDTELAHMDPETIAMAQAMGILPEAKQNVMTGLPAFQGDNPSEETDDEPAAGVGAPTGETDTGTSPPSEMAGFMNPTMQDISKQAEARDAAVGMANNEAIAGALAKMSPHQQNVAKDYGFTRDPALMAELANMPNPDMTDRMQEMVDARHAHNPTMRQLDLNARTERGFQQANPGLTQAMGVAGTLMGLAVPGMGFVTMPGNVMNTMQGRPNLIDMAVGNIAGDPTATGQAISGIRDTFGGFVDSITDAVSNIGRTVGIGSLSEGPLDTDLAATPEEAAALAGDTAASTPSVPTDVAENEPGDNQDIIEKSVEEDLKDDDAVPPVEGINAEQEKLIAEGYDPAVAETIVENFRTVDAFKQSYRFRFNAEPSASQMDDPSKRSFINIGRGQIQGMT